MATIADAVVSIKADTRDFDRSINQAKSGLRGLATTNIGDLAKGFAIGTLAVQGLQKAVQLAQDSLMDFAKAGREITKLEAVLMATGHAAGFSVEELSAFSDEYGRLAGIDPGKIMDTMAVLATFKEIKGDTFKEVTKLAQDMSVVLGTDARSAAIQLGKAFNDPVKGATALSRAGVQFTDDQKEMIKGMIEAGDLAGAQGVIMKELKGQMGDVARIAGEDLVGTFGRVQEAINVAKEEFGGLISNLLGGQSGIEMVGDLFYELANLIRDLAPLFKVVGLAFKGLVAGLTIGLATIRTGAMYVVAAFKLILNLFAAIADGIGGYSMKDAFGEFKNDMGSASKILGDTFIKFNERYQEEEIRRQYREKIRAADKEDRLALNKEMLRKLDEIRGLNMQTANNTNPNNPANAVVL